MDFRELVDDDPVVVDPSWDVGKVYFNEFQAVDKDIEKIPYLRRPGRMRRQRPLYL